MKEDKRRDATIINHNRVHEVDERLQSEWGEMYWAISRSKIYEMIKAEVGLSTRRVQWILGHTRKIE